MLSAPKLTLVSAVLTLPLISSALVAAGPLRLDKRQTAGYPNDDWGAAPRPFTCDWKSVDGNKSCQDSYHIGDPRTMAAEVFCDHTVGDVQGKIGECKIKSCKTGSKLEADGQTCMDTKYKTLNWCYPGAELTSDGCKCMGKLVFSADINRCTETLQTTTSATTASIRI